MIMCQLQGEICSDTVYKLIQSYNEAAKINENVYIYLNSDGGDTEAMECIIDIINNNKDITKLIGYGRLLSAAFFIFFRAECNREILFGTYGMCHYIRTSIEIDEKGKAYYESDKFMQKWMRDQNAWTNNLCIKLGMTSKELSRIKKREEVYFQYERLIELLNYKEEQ